MPSVTNKNFSKGKANQRSLGDRMKAYEEVTTNRTLVERLPIYVRLDMRAGHTFCRGLEKPFDERYSRTMRETTSYLVEKTGAILGYCQSDEISLVYEDSTKIPFGTRLFKLESVLASMCTSSFVLNGIKNGLSGKIEKTVPSFDCRVCNLPDMDEASNMIFWRIRDSIKNSITLLSLEYFSNKEIHGKNSDEKCMMLWEKYHVDYGARLCEGYRYGFFFRREPYDKVLAPEEIKRIPEKNLEKLKCTDGKYSATRSHVVAFELEMLPEYIKNRTGVLFYREKPVLDEVKFKSTKPLEDIM